MKTPAVGAAFMLADRGMDRKINRQPDLKKTILVICNLAKLLLSIFIKNILKR